MCGYGQCRDCGCAVERPGWDDICFSCQADRDREMGDPYWDEAEGVT